MATEEVRRQWFIDIAAPLTNRDPDYVPEEVVEEEMSLFHTLKRQTNGGGG